LGIRPAKNETNVQWAGAEDLAENHLFGLCPKKATYAIGESAISQGRTPLPYGETHPRPPPNKYNTSNGKKGVAIKHATFFVTFDDFGNGCIQKICKLIVQE
jgi:hypothetical protein